MTLQSISIILGILAVSGGVLGIVRPEFATRVVELFPRSVVPAWILTALCCWMGAREALEMNMGFMDAYKQYIYILAPGVFIASVVYMKELLAPRALGGFLLLIAVPILQEARWHECAWRLVVVVLVYLWIIYGLVLLLSPWWFRKTYQSFISNKQRFKAAVFGKVAFGLALLLLGIFIY